MGKRNRIQLQEYKLPEALEENGRLAGKIAALELEIALLRKEKTKLEKLVEVQVKK